MFYENTFFFLFHNHINVESKITKFTAYIGAFLYTFILF